MTLLKIQIYKRANKDTALKWGFVKEIIKIIYSCSYFAGTSFMDLHTYSMLKH